MRITKLIAPVLLASAMLIASNRANAGVVVSIAVAPPALPVYDQPLIPGPGYIWTPGYWSYDDDEADYYWVPGTWVLAPSPGLLWTPGYWGWRDGIYVWRAGYWGPHVGFYGGVAYGFGYTGIGFAGGFWSGGVFTYNRACTNVNTTIIHNTYSKTVIINNNIKNVSFNGGADGIKTQPTAADRLAEHEQHISPTTEQTQHQLLASKNQDLRASFNKGKPRIAAVAKAGEFSGKGIVSAKSAGEFKRTSLQNTNKERFDQNHLKVRDEKIANTTPKASPQHTDGFHGSQQRFVQTHGGMRPNAFHQQGRPPMAKKASGKSPKKPTQ